jgi:hypothetical protein
VARPTQSVLWGLGARLAGGLIVGIAALFSFSSHGGSAVAPTQVQPRPARLARLRVACTHAGLVDMQAIGRKGGSRSPLTRLRQAADDDLREQAREVLSKVLRGEDVDKQQFGRCALAVQIEARRRRRASAISTAGAGRRS